MIFISPHPDDEVLFGAYTIMRNKPIVVIVTHPTLQGDNGEERLLESYRAMRLLESPVMFLGIPESELTEETLTRELNKLNLIDEIVYIPAKDGGHAHHDLIHDVCSKLFWNTVTYKTYGKGETRAIGWEVDPTDEEKELKQKAMQCYKTQIENTMTSHYFNTDKEYE